MGLTEIQSQRTRVCLKLSMYTNQDCYCQFVCHLNTVDMTKLTLGPWSLSWLLLFAQETIPGGDNKKQLITEVHPAQSTCITLFNKKKLHNLVSGGNGYMTLLNSFCGML